MSEILTSALRVRLLIKIGEKLHCCNVSPNETSQRERDENIKTISFKNTSVRTPFFVSSAVFIYNYSRYNVQAVFKVTETTGWDVKHLAASEVRIIILYCTQNEASSILEAAEKSGLTSNKYLWLVTQSVIGDPGDRSINRRYLPVGMLGEL